MVAVTKVVHTVMVNTRRRFPIRLSVSLSRWQHDTLHQLADSKQRTPSTVVRDALMAYYTANGITPPSNGDKTP